MRRRENVSRVPFPFQFPCGRVAASALCSSALVFVYRRRKFSFDFVLSFFLLSFQRPLATSFAFLEVSHDSVGLSFFCGALSLTVFCLAFCSASSQVWGKGAPG